MKPKPFHEHRARSGADYHAKKDRWRGVIEFNRKVYRSPYFLTKQEAESWYAAKSHELYGYDRVNDLRLNDPDINAQGNSKAQLRTLRGRNGSMIEQRSEEWYQARLGKATASRFHDIMVTGRAGQTLSGWKNYKAELIIERLTGKPLDNFQSKEMLWGVETEPLARLYYTLNTGNQVEEASFFEHVQIAAGASPDGLIGTDGGLEIKCPNPATHIETLHNKQVPKQYIAQVQGNMWITGRKWWDFVSFDPRMPENAKYIMIHVPRDDAYIEALEGRIRLFLREVDEELEFVNNYGKAVKPKVKNEVQPRRTKSS